MYPANNSSLKISTTGGRIMQEATLFIINKLSYLYIHLMVVSFIKISAPVWPERSAVCVVAVNLSG